MKKVIKNYLAKLQENDKKGFSLVELIIVMAIMAILVGIVASQVLPYMEKSRMSKDQQQLSSLCTDIVSAISQADGTVSTFAATELKDCDATTGGADWVTDGTTATPVGTIETNIAGKFKSKTAKAASAISVAYDNTTGQVTVYCGDGSVDKLKVVSE